MGSTCSTSQSRAMIEGNDRDSSETFLRLDCGSLGTWSFVARGNDATRLRRSSLVNCSGRVGTSNDRGTGSAVNLLRSSTHLYRAVSNECNMIYCPRTLTHISVLAVSLSSSPSWISCFSRQGSSCAIANRDTDLWVKQALATVIRPMQRR